ncbi:unnamed protein product [Prunus armeniaca]
MHQILEGLIYRTSITKIDSTIKAQAIKEENSKSTIQRQQMLIQNDLYKEYLLVMFFSSGLQIFSINKLRRIECFIIRNKRRSSLINTAKLLRKTTANNY